MAPFVVLTVTFVVFRSLGWLGLSFFDNVHVPLQAAVACMFLLAASAHWGKRRPDLINMVPPVFPAKKWIVSMTGWLEIAGAIGIVIPYTSRAASIGLALLLIAMFPANVYASRKGIGIAGKRATPLFVRTVLQVVFIAAVLTAGFLEE